MYSIFSANGRFTENLYANHLDAFKAFRESKMIGIAFIVREYDGVIVYDAISDGNEAWCYTHEEKNSRATARLSA